MNRLLPFLMTVWTMVSTCGRTPESILYKEYGITLADVNYSVQIFNDYIYPNGDGETELLISFNGQLSKDSINSIANINGITHLPIPSSIKEYIPSVLQNANNGYYYFKRTDPNNTVLDHILFIYSIDLGLIYYHVLVT